MEPVVVESDAVIDDVIGVDGWPTGLAADLLESAELVNRIGRVRVVFDGETYAPKCGDWDAVEIVNEETAPITAAGLSDVNTPSGLANGYCYSYSNEVSFTIAGEVYVTSEGFGVAAQTVLVWDPPERLKWVLSVGSQSLVDGRSGNVGLPGQLLADSIMPFGWPKPDDFPPGTPVSATVVSIAWMAVPNVTDAGADCEVNWSDPQVAQVVNTTEPLVLTAAGLEGVGVFRSEPDVGRCYSYGNEITFQVANRTIVFSEPPGNPLQTVLTWPQPAASSTGGHAAGGMGIGLLVSFMFVVGIALLVGVAIFRKGNAK
jgi:hypothetical protein